MQSAPPDLARRHIRLGGGCRAWPIRLFGYRAVMLENRWLRATFLVDRGGAIYELLWKPDDHDILWRWERGLRPAQATPGLDLPQGNFQDHFFGGWDLMFPSAFDLEPSEALRAGYHGDVWAQPWSWSLVEDSPAAVELELTTQCVRHPFVVRRTFRLEAALPTLRCRTRIDNRAPVATRFAIGEHATWNVTHLLGDGGRLVLPGGTVHTTPDPPPTARLLPGSVSTWPHAPAGGGSERDLSALGPGVRGTAEIVAVAVTEPRLTLEPAASGPRVELRWDRELLPYLVLWLGFGGDIHPPWFGTAEVLGAEPVCALPWTGADQLPTLPPHGSVSTAWEVRIGTD